MGFDALRRGQSCFGGDCAHRAGCPRVRTFKCEPYYAQAKATPYFMRELGSPSPPSSCGRAHRMPVRLKSPVAQANTQLSRIEKHLERDDPHHYRRGNRRCRSLAMILPKQQSSRPRQSGTLSKRIGNGIRQSDEPDPATHRQLITSKRLSCRTEQPALFSRTY